jgi:hypothetical protein
MEFSILPSGYRDLAEGRDFYDNQAPGIGTYFLESAFAEVESLRIYAGTHRVVFGYHRLLMKRFPFAVFYKIEGNVAVVYRVLDCRRNPKAIGDPLSGKP